MNLKTIIFIFLCMLMRLFIYGSKLFNYSTAVEKCKERHGLASYKHFIYSERHIENNENVLGNGKSVWISGNVSFSNKFVRWHGCFGVPRDNLRISNFSRNIIYECVTLCSKVEQKYIGIGIENNLCYCITQNDLQRRLTLKNNSDCYHHFSITDFVTGQAFSNKYQKTAVTVYKWKASGSFMWKPISNNNLGQCVYYQMNGTDGSYVTGSCYTKKTGYICTNSDNGKFSAGCTNYKKHFNSSSFHSYCYGSGPTTWISSFKQCKQLSVNLIGSLNENIRMKISQLKGPASFWTGFFRSFNLTDSQDKEFANEWNICLSVINVNSTIMFDPVDCSSEKEYICEDDITKFEEQTTYSSDENNALSSTTVGYSFSTKMPDFPDYSIVIILPTIFVAIVILVCIIFRKKIKQRVCVRQVETRTINIKGENPNNISCNSESAEKSSNPRRQEIINQSITLEVEYDMPSEVLPINDAVNSEYDRVNTNLFRQQTRDQSSTRNDINDYDVHTGITLDDDTNEYDHLEAHVRKQLNSEKASTDGIYNTMAAENETYNVLTLKDNVNVSESDVKKNCSTYG